VSLFAPRALAQDTAAAARAFQTAQRAELTEDFERAAEFYELADSLAESAAAIRSALRMRRAAGEEAEAGRHAESLLRRYPDDEASSQLALRTLAELAPRLGRLRVRCGSAPCRPMIGDRAIDSPRGREHAFLIAPGTAEISAEYSDGIAGPRSVTVAARGEASVEFEPPPPPAPAEVATSTTTTTTVPAGGQTGISPWFFATGVVAAIGLGIGATVSGLGALDAGDRFYSNGRTRALYDTADGLELQTNILIVSAATVGAVAIILAIFTDWDGDPPSAETSEQARLRVLPGPGDLGLSLQVDHAL
jgi:hypothetical protein